jgi:predicted transposase/invertase (TIGR01784 family)
MGPITSQKVYLIALLEDFTLKIGTAEDYIHDICLCNRDNGEIFYDKLGYTFIELSNFVKQDTELKTDLDKWLYVLKNMSQMDKIPVYLRKPIFEKLFNIAEYTNLTKEEKTMYDSSLKYRWDNKNVLDYALKEGFEQGVEQGIEQGIEKGIERGEHNKAIAIAREMKKEGFSTEQISKFTGLSNDEINGI